MDASLTLVPTPIGNLEDITFRAIKVLREVNLILSEDTRQTSKLLKHYEIENKLTAFHQHNEHKIVDRLVQDLKSGVKMALVTDAGTPGISDPGFLLVRACVEAGVEVNSLPGATAFVPALVNSGIPCDRFCFEGFLPHKKGRQKRLKELELEQRTIVFYESPHRLLKALGEFSTYFGDDRQMSVSREITKMYEETIRGSVKELIEYFTKHPIKGEVVVVLSGSKEKP